MPMKWPVYTDQEGRFWANGVQDQRTDCLHFVNPDTEEYFGSGLLPIVLMGALTSNRSSIKHCLSLLPVILLALAAVALACSLLPLVLTHLISEIVPLPPV